MSHTDLLVSLVCTLFSSKDRTYTTFRGDNTLRCSEVDRLVNFSDAKSEQLASFLLQSLPLPYMYISAGSLVG